MTKTQVTLWISLARALLTSGSHVMDLRRMLRENPELHREAADLIHEIYAQIIDPTDPKRMDR